MRSFRLAAILTIIASSPIAAWGPEAHHAVAIVAEQRLTATTRAAVIQLLDGRSMSSVSTWADDVLATRPNTYNWHHVNIPLGGGGYNPGRDCQPSERGDCIINALTRLERDLANRTVPKRQRREALMFIIHLVADIHQPLHASGNVDSGGRKWQISAIGGATNLHDAWDSGIIRSQGTTAEQLAAEANAGLIRQRNAPLSVKLPKDWATEAYQLAGYLAYPQVQGDNQISESEAQLDIEVIENQIGKAGIRLAAMLNAIFDSSHHPQ